MACATIELSEGVLLSAFGSSSVAKSDHATPLYLNREINEHTCFDCDTLLGLQLDYQLLDNVNTSIQVVKRPQDTWSQPALEWLYVGYNYKQFDVKVGRLRLPLLLDSEYYFVGHAYTAARPPQEVYDSLFGLTSYDGMSLQWQGELNDTLSLSIEPYGTFLGESDVQEGRASYTFFIHDMVGLNVELSSYNFRLFVNSAQATYDMDLTFSGIAGIVPAFTQRLENEKLTFHSIGGEYLWESVALRAEMYASKTSSNWYTQLAYLGDKVTPYISYAEMDSAGTRIITNYTVTAGLRIDFTPSFSVNIEAQKMSSDESNNLLFGPGQFTEYIPSGEDIEANVYTLMFNFIL